MDLGTQVTDGVRSGHPAKGLDSGDAIPLEGKSKSQCSRWHLPRPRVQGLGVPSWTCRQNAVQSWEDPGEHIREGLAETPARLGVGGNRSTRL